MPQLLPRPTRLCACQSAPHSGKRQASSADRFQWDCFPCDRAQPEVLRDVLPSSETPSENPMAFDYVAERPVFKVAIIKYFRGNYYPLTDRGLAKYLAPYIGGFFGIVGRICLHSRSRENISDEAYKIATTFV